MVMHNSKDSDSDINILTFSISVYFLGNKNEKIQKIEQLVKTAIYGFLNLNGPNILDEIFVSEFDYQQISNPKIREQSKMY